MLVQIEISKLSSLLKSDNKIERAMEKKHLLTFDAFFFFPFHWLRAYHVTCK